MKSRTPGFIGARLREAREARGLTMVSLADLLGVSRAMISQYESGLATPGPEVMSKIPKVLNLEAHFFFLQLDEAQEKPRVFYRSLGSATKLARTMAEARLRWVYRDIIPYLLEFVELPAVNFPRFNAPNNPTSISNSEIEGVAMQAREHWNLGTGPISNVVWLLENNGAIITRGAVESDALDSFSTWVGGLPHIFLNSEKDSAARERMNAAHELGHLILHKNIDRNVLLDSALHALIEAQAFRFAGAFLLPDMTFASEVYMPTLMALQAIKPKWRVSIAMMIKRAGQLELIMQDQERRLWIAYSKKGWRHNGEPWDDEFPLEEPQLQRQSIELMLNHTVQSRQDVLYKLPYSIKDIAEFLGVTPEYLSVGPDSVHLKTPAKIIQFPT